MYECYVYNNGNCYFQRGFDKLSNAKSFMKRLCDNGLKGKIKGEREKVLKWYNKNK